MIYDVGLVFYTNVNVDIARDEQTQTRILELCLGNEAWQEREMYVYVTEPFEHGLSDLTPIQEFYLYERSVYPLDKLVSLEEVFNTTLKNVAALAQQEGEACLYTEIPYY